MIERHFRTALLRVLWSVMRNLHGGRVEVNVSFRGEWIQRCVVLVKGEKTVVKLRLGGR